jgi:hypothetical protein
MRDLSRRTLPIIPLVPTQSKNIIQWAQSSTLAFLPLRASMALLPPKARRTAPQVPDRAVNPKKDGEDGRAMLPGD